ncbi:gliding motility-associated ABC transporter substrate-binding protein GldG [Flavicella sediminum]|uniref:gliding motility-associated ABC transporter substrate-binding protein GldG n=1 Tax=Flavicella sediminum TaxID=2585141 RepID=UPI00111F7BEC|nr:gliding motility-associated ABC transporter substrate-binding protein GldG [Flavicella sediminum]
MFAILKKELRLFFGTTVGYFVIGSFLLLNSLLLWFFDNDSNILNAGFADLTSFFTLSPWLFSLLIPALAMKSFSEEINSGTIEILKTKPITNLQLILGKYFSVLSIVSIALLPTLLYTFSIYQLALPIGNIDFGVLIGSYIGLLFIASAFVAISLWISTFSNNSLVVLLAAIVSCFFMYYGFYSVASIFGNKEYFIIQLGMHVHFESIARGVIDSQDLIYFLSVSLFFITLSYTRMASKKNWKPFIYISLAIVVLQLLSPKISKRLDLSSDQRYTLSTISKDLVKDLDEQVVVRVYLEGDFPVEFKRLQLETQQLLRELKVENKNLKVLFIDPKNDLTTLIKKGLEPSKLTVEENGVVSESIILPWATIHYKNKIEHISLLKNSTQATRQEAQLESSIQNLEFAFSNAFKKISSEKNKSIAILTGNGELEDLQLFSFLKDLSKQYHLGKFTLDSVQNSPKQTLEQLQKYDLAIIAKPTVAFSEEEKYVLDQYTLNGGNTLWMLDHVYAEMDSLYKGGRTLAYTRDLNLDDFFFRYGARINHNIVKDLYSAKIALATGNTGNKTNFQNFLWFYHPVVNPSSKHPIVHNLGGIRLQFPSTIDTLKNNIKKTILLESSVLTRIVETPNFIELKSVAEKPDPKIYAKGKQILGVLFEGKFTSAYKDRQKPFATNSAKEIGSTSKMVVISDGDLAANQTQNGKPLELGIDKWTQEQFSNKEFLQNTVDYLLDDSGILKLRSKQITLRTLDKALVSQNRLYWQVLNIFTPILLLTIFGLGFLYIRKRKYLKH